MPAPAPSRRRFLVGAAGWACSRIGSGWASASSSRAVVGSAATAGSIAIPTPIDLASPIPAGADLGIEGVAPFVTANDDFYRVDTALDIPVIDAADWRLRIHGMVDREIEFTLADLLDLPTIERDITLTCVSNQVGGPTSGTLAGSASRSSTVLDEAGIQAGADQIVSRSVDGMTIGTPTAVALDGRDAMLAVAMNGEAAATGPRLPRPDARARPVRLRVGNEVARRNRITTFDAYDPYWVQRGWAEEAPIKTMARIDAAKPLARLASGSRRSSAVWPGRSTAASTASRSGWMTGPGPGTPGGGRFRSIRAASGASNGRPPAATTPSRSERRIWTE